MIKVNLAKARPKKNTDVSATFDAAAPVDLEVQRAAVLRVVMFLLGPLSLYILSSFIIIPEKVQKLAEKNKQVVEMTGKNNAAASAVSEMKDFEKDESKLKEQIGVIDSLRKDRMREVKVLDVIQREMPEHLWITKMEVVSGKMSIQGLAGASSDRNQLIDSLNKSSILKDVNLLKTDEEIIDGNKLESFSIECIFPSIEAQPAGKS